MLLMASAVVVGCYWLWAGYAYLWGEGGGWTKVAAHPAQGSMPLLCRQVLVCAVGLGLHPILMYVLYVCS
jgi:hypothetical protein